MSSSSSCNSISMQCLGVASVLGLNMAILARPWKNNFMDLDVLLSEMSGAEKRLLLWR